MKHPSIIFQENPSSGFRVLRGRTYRRTEMTKPIVAFHNFSKAPINILISVSQSRLMRCTKSIGTFVGNVPTHASFSSLVCLGASVDSKTACVNDVVQNIKRVQRIISFTSGGMSTLPHHFLTKPFANMMLKKFYYPKKNFR
jgi:hypothetical protein